ncbi:MAG: FKBP-type peptidyl-prolyl cis-trans isomerase [Fibrobacter sp.]|nr:FKBP-type peptidyl-prolyl cis-trans isomerase [Fibrobacter sp.]MDY6389173.1 FKBP-type peptidyl-prolyl cis-trans isomerase [Fibrobacter sp.]
MKLWTSSIFSAAILGTLIACSSSPKPETAPAAAVAPADSASVAVKKDTLVTPKDRYSYALGMDMGRAIKNVEAEIDKDLFLKSLSDQMDGKPLLMTDSQAEKALQELVLQMQVAREKKAAEEAKAALDSQKVFLEKNKAVEGVITTASGLQYKYITKSSDSTAKTPKLSDKVRVHYAGALLNGTEFDSSIKRGEPLEFPVNAVIKGWQELLTLMKEGEKVKAWIPSALGYGAEGASPVIPPNALLVFEVELLNVVSTAPVVDTAKVKTPEELKADSIAAVKAAKKAEQDSIKAAKKAEQDSIKAAKKAKQDSIAAAKKAKADSIAAVKAAKKAEQDSIKAAKKAEQDSIKAAKKAKQDSIAAVKKAKQDSIAAVKKAKQDSIAAAKKAKADSIAAVKAAKKAEQDSIKAAKKAEQDSIAAAKKAAQAEPVKTEAPKTETPKAEPAKAEAAPAEAPKAATAPAVDSAKASAPAAK